MKQKILTKLPADWPVKLLALANMVLAGTTATLVGQIFGVLS